MFLPSMGTEKGIEGSEKKALSAKPWARTQRLSPSARDASIAPSLDGPGMDIGPINSAVSPQPSLTFHGQHLV
jgi:hypothetical protein